jgi:hypothetical protein
MLFFSALKKCVYARDDNDELKENKKLPTYKETRTSYQRKHQEDRKYSPAGLLPYIVGICFCYKCIVHLNTCFLMAIIP